MGRRWLNLLDVARVMIFVTRPRHAKGEEAHAWLERELADLDGNGVDRVQLKRLADASSRYGSDWFWMVQIDCRDLDVAREVLRNGHGMILLADLRLLGMRPSVALLEDGS